MHTSLSLHFIDVQCLDMFRALLAHPQEALHERRIGDLCAVVDVGWSQDMGRGSLNVLKCFEHYLPILRRHYTDAEL
jgi:hypothetical protein